MKFVEYTGEVIPDKKQDKTFEKDEGGFKVSSIEQLSKDLGNDWWHLPAAFIAGAGLAKAGQAAHDWYKSKQAAPELQPRVEPTLAPAQADVVDVQAKPAPSPTEVLDTRLAQAKAANTPVAPAAPNAPAMPPMAAPAGAGVPSGGVAPMPAPTVTEAAATGANPTKTVQTEVAKLVDETPAGGVAPKTRAPKTEKFTFKSEKDLPAGTVFRPDVGNLDRSLYNILGPEHRQYAKDLLNEGKMFGQSANLNKDVSKLTTEYFKKLQEQVPETILSREARIAQGVPHQGMGSFGGLGKAVKVAGVAGTLLTLADAALAKTPQERARAGNDVLNAVLPPSMSINEVGAGSELSPEILAKQIKYLENQYKLGSPYAQSEEAKKYRLKEKAGAGRGIAPPSAYLR